MIFDKVELDQVIDEIIHANKLKFKRTNDLPYGSRDILLDRFERKPLTFSEATRQHGDKKGSIKHLFPYYINEDYYNKTISLLDKEEKNHLLKITVIHDLIGPTDIQYNYGYSWGCRTGHCSWDEQICVYVEYKGAINQLANFNLYQYITLEECKEDQTNYGNLKFTATHKYILKEAKITAYNSEFDSLKDLFIGLDDNLNRLKIEDAEFKFDEGTSSDRTRKIDLLSFDKKDFVDLIMGETVNNIWKPSYAIINRWLIQENPEKYGGKIANDWNRNILKKLNIEQVQFTNETAFNILEFFDLDGIKVKASKKVIDKYNLSKYALDDKLVKELAADKAKEKKIAAVKAEKNKFTLMQGNKVIIADKNKQEIIQYLESYSSKDSVQVILDFVKPIFDKFKSIDKMYIGNFGTMTEYESKGNTYSGFWDDFTYMNDGVIDDEICEQIEKLYLDNNNPEISDRELEILFGWPENECRIGVKRNGKKLELFDEDEDEE